MIETLEEAALSLLKKRSDEAVRAFRLAVRPLLAVEPARNPVLEHAGTCILLTLDGHKVLCTAAHILNRRTEGTVLFVSGPPGTRSVRMDGGVTLVSKAPQGDRSYDWLDCGFWLIPEDAAQQLGGVEFLDVSRISHNRADTERRYYMAMGFALSRNKGANDRAARTVWHRLSRFSGSVMQMPELAAKMHVSGAQHMFLRYQKYAQAQDGGRIQAFAPKGLSGGPLIDLGDFTMESAYATDLVHRASLSGMLIEFHRKHHAIVAVKIGPIIETIRRHLRRAPAT